MAEQEGETITMYEKAKCPMCGATLQELVLQADPPIHLAKCPDCGFENRVEPQEKPPIGCAPYYVRISERVQELTGAIRRNIAEPKKHNQIKLLAAEIQYLNEMDRMLRRVEKEKTWVEQKDGTLKEVE